MIMQTTVNCCIKRVYVLSGASNAGKTSTLNLLAKMLDNDKARFSRIGTWKLKMGWHDGKCVFKEKSSGRRIGIVTAGDGGRQIIDGFTFLSQNRCEVCFVASKTSGVSVETIESQYVKTCKIIPRYRFLINEYAARSPRTIWRDVARQLFSEI